MSPLHRRIFFYVLLAIFLITGPIIVARSFGYTFDFSRQVVEQTGGIFIKSYNSNASVFVDNIFNRETSFFSGGALLPEVTPGTHLVRLEKASLQPWSKAISVEPGVVTELRDVLLIPYGPLVSTSTEARTLANAISEPTPAELSLTKTGNLTEKIAKTTRTVLLGVHSFTANTRTILAVTTNGTLERFDRNTANLTILGHPGLHLANGSIQFLNSPSGEVALRDGLGYLFFLSDTGTINVVDTNVLNMRFDADGEKILTIKTTEIDLIWLKANTFQSFQKAGTREKIFSLESPIRDAAWFYRDNAHVFIQADSGIYLTETDGRGGRNTQPIYEGKTQEMMTFPQVPDRIFFRKGQTWYEVAL